MTATAAIILAAGQSKRMKSARSKVLHDIGGRPLIHHVLATCAGADLAPVVVVTSPGASDLGAVVMDAASHAKLAVQTEALGTGHAVQAGLPAIEDFSGDLVVLFGDTPLVTPETILQMKQQRRGGADVVVLGFRAADPAGYGRLVLGANGALDRIVEAKDASPEELSIDFVNSGVLLADADRLRELLSAVTNNNAAGEYYLTDVVRLARAQGLVCRAIECPEDEVIGVNSRVDLAKAEAVLQDRLRGKILAGGVTLVAPETVFLSADTEIGADTWVGPNVVFGPGVKVGEGAIIKSFSHLEGATLADGAEVGPYARLRPGAEIGKGARIGNFVEVKKAKIEEGAKVNHLSYIGDARVGAKANIGAGVITCNYDGFDKYQTDIGAGAFVGTNSSLVAPVTIADGAYIGSGSVITKDVEENALGLSRPEQKQISGWAAKFRARKSKG